MLKSKTRLKLSFWDVMAEKGGSPELKALLAELFASQYLAVLATVSADGRPYTNLVAFAEADGLESLLFITKRDTRKYSNAIIAEKVAVLVDNRKNYTSDVNTAIAVTALGNIKEVPVDDRGDLVRVYVSKHPHLMNFATNPANALMKVTVTDYFIASFNDVTLLHLGD